VTAPTLVWFRQDLRLADHAALTAAIERGAPVIPVFIWAPDEEGEWAPGAASRWWLHQSLSALDQSLVKIGSRLIVRHATDTAAELHRLLKESGATAVYWSRRYEPRVIARDQSIKQGLRDAGIEARSFNSALLVEPWDVQNNSGKPFQVFTPYWRKVSATLELPKPLPSPTRIPAPQHWPESTSIAALALLPKIHWYSGMQEAWQPGERGAMQNFDRFLDGSVANYGETRNLPAQAGTSRLSPHLHFGEISPRQIWHTAAQWRSSQFMAEIGWREFAHHLLYHFPRTTNEPLRLEYQKFPWLEDPEHLQAWQRGRTGVPLVDAGMRELWHTGWMHNRVRMVVASFLVKNLRLHWLEGARWFWDTLVDADLASNTLGWQWAAGCGADAAPYFRVFNPESQAEKFDAKSEYIQRWIGGDKQYPASPIVDLKESRAAAITAWQTLRKPQT
jgi:deoxyribodipyrimidine photo-lyase